VRGAFLGVLTLVFLLALGLPASAESPPSHRVVANCADDSAGSVTVVSPRPGVSVPRDSVVLVIRGKCRGGLPIQVGANGVGLGLKSDGKLAPEPDYNPGCSQCWPQLAGITGDAGQRSYGLLLKPGSYTLTVKAGIQGTDLPSWSPIRFPIEVVKATLPATGGNLLPLLLGAFVLASVAALARGRPKAQL
jgi:hypothetical protein